MSQYNKITQFSPSRVKRDNFFTYACYTLDQAEADPTVSTECAEYVAALKGTVQILDEAMVRSAKAEQTEEIAACNTRRMTFFRAFRRVVKSMLLSSDANISAAAKRLNQALIDYRFNEYGNIDNITSALFNLLQDLKGKNANDVTTIDSTELVNQLYDANNCVYELVEQRNSEDAKRVDGEVEAARKDVTTAMDNLFEAVNSKAFFDKEGKYISFISFINRYIVRIKRYAMGKKAKAAEATPGQPLGPEEDINKPGTGTDTNKPGTDDTNKPGSDDTNKPGSDDTNKPGTDDTNKPGTDDTNKPGTDDSNKPGSDDTNKPSDDQGNGSTGDGSDGDGNGSGENNPNLPPPPTGGGESGFDW